SICCAPRLRACTRAPAVRDCGPRRSDTRDVVGRDAELDAVGSFLREPPAGPRALVLEGPPGIGKTTIFRAALADAESAGLRIFRARPAAGEAELPYAALGDLLATVDERAFTPLPAPQRDALLAALRLARRPGAVEQPALARGLLELLRLNAAEGDLLIAVDDVQWLDRPTADALTFAFRRLERETAAGADGPPNRDGARCGSLRARRLGRRRTCAGSAAPRHGARRARSDAARRAACSTGARRAGPHHRRKPD